MSDYKISLIPGDGIGKEVMPEGVRVLEAAGRKFDIQFGWKEYDWSCETFHRTGRMMPEDGMNRCVRVMLSILAPSVTRACLTMSLCGGYLSPSGVNLTNMSI